jgi:hypothetical protein
LYHIVQLLSKNQQSKEDSQHADLCIKILFDTNKTEHWGSLLCVDFGTQLAFRKMNNFAVPLVIMSWHRMVQEFFSCNAGYTFFDIGDYSETQENKKHVVYGDKLHMETIFNNKKEQKLTTLIASVQIEH